MKSRWLNRFQYSLGISRRNTLTLPEPTGQPKDRTTGIDFARWMDACPAGRSIYEISGFLGIGLDDSYGYVAKLGANLFLAGGYYRLAKGCKRGTLPNPPRSHA